MIATPRKRLTESGLLARFVLSMLVNSRESCKPQEINARRACACQLAANALPSKNVRTSRLWNPTGTHYLTTTLFLQSFCKKTLLFAVNFALTPTKRG